MLLKLIVRVICLAVLTAIAVSCSNDKISNAEPLKYSNQMALGRYLFFDRRLSVNNTKSCGTCHNPQFAFTDGYKRSLGAFADLHQRNTQPLFNLKEYKYFTAADSSIQSLEQQMNNPLFNTHPVEMGVNGHEEEILGRIQADPLYQKLFTISGYNISWQSVKKMIAGFMISIQSYNSRYDQFITGDSASLDASEKKGMALFFSKQLNCASCHGGKNFSEPTIKNSDGSLQYYFNIGLYNTDGKGAYPEYDQGLYHQTAAMSDMGKFRIPGLRNLRFTAPFYHDGSAEDLMAVINNLASGGRNISSGIYHGDGRKNPYKHPFIKGFKLSKNDRENLAAFLFSLTDSSMLTNPAWQNPFTDDETKRNSNLQ